MQFGCDVASKLFRDHPVERDDKNIAACHRPPVRMKKTVNATHQPERLPRTGAGLDANRLRIEID